MNAATPLVSIIVRSMNRPLIGEALASIAAQDYPHIEVVLVNASGGPHADVGATCGAFPIRMVETGERLRRPLAANLGLRSAWGEYLIFLDDDDWIYPDHISGLVAALAAGDGARAAYGGVEYLDAPGAAERVLMNAPFDAARLRIGNFIPIHAVLFDKSLVAEGCRFDESLDLYEDWDFWLQVSRLTPFLHVDKISAAYRNSGASGVGPSADGDLVAASREAVLRKWKEKWSAAELDDMLTCALRFHLPDIERLKQGVSELSSALADSEERVAAQEKRLESQEEQIGDLSTQLHQRNLQIEKLLSSTSWRVSAPVRWAGYQILRAKKLRTCLQPLLDEPRKIPDTITRLRHARRVGGSLAMKQLLLQLPYEISFNDLWLRYRQSFTPEKEAEIREDIGRMAHRPLISILMPTFDTPEQVLKQTIESVIDQLYPDWELCVVDDASRRSHVRHELEAFSARDSRIRVEFRERNGGIAAATNQALAMAKGAFVVLLDHDDLLEKQALYRVAESILADDPDMIYSDEAVLSDDGTEVINHVFRPAFSPERLRTSPYVVHLVAFRTELLKRIGGLDVSLKISQDYDLILRASEAARSIVHIPEVLYLWRERKASAGHKKENEVMATSRRVLARHLERCGEQGTVRDGAVFNYFDVRYPLQPGLRVAIIIPTKNHGELVRQCVDSIERTVKDVPYEIVVIDHESSDPGTLAYFRDLASKHRVMRYQGPFNFSAINNWAVSQLDGTFSHYLFCNNDIEATDDGWLGRMMELCQKPDIGMVGAKLFYPDGRTYQHAGVCVGLFGIAEHYAKFMDNRLPDKTYHPGYHGTLIANHEVAAVTAACALMRRDAFEAIGGFDEAIAVGFGDVDLCLRTLEAGYRILFCPHASLIHHESFTRGKSSGEDPHPEDSAFFSRKWRKFLDRGDPYFNPNLAIHSTRWEIKQPMEFDLHVTRRVFRRRSLEEERKPE